MYSQQRPNNAATYEYDAQYQPQSSDERLWYDGIQKRPVPQKSPNYKPTPLRWYFIVLLILSIMGLMALVVWAKLAMPDSDTSYTNLHDVHRRWDEVQTIPRPPVGLGARALAPSEKGINTPPPSSSSSSSKDEETFAGDAYRGATTFTTEVSSLVTLKPTTKTFTSMVPTTIYSTIVKTESGFYRTGGVATSWIPFTTTSHYVTNIVTSLPGSVTKITKTNWISGYHTFPFTGSVYSSSAWSSPVETTETKTLPGTVITSQSTVTKTIVSSSSVEFTQEPSSLAESDVGPITLTSAIATSTVQSVGTTTQAPTTFIRLGKVTITSYYTDPNYKNPPQNKPTEKPKTKVVDVVTTEPGRTVKEVESLGPVTFVSEVHATVKTVVATQPPMTIVSNVGGHTTVVDVTTIGEDGLPTTSQVVSTVGGKLTTFLRTAGSKQTIVSEVGGFTTLVEVTTTGEDGLPTVTQVLSTAEGQLTTFVGTVGPEETITSEIGGFTTTFEATKWGTDGLPTKTKIVSTSTGSLTTFVSTFKPSTFVTTRSGFRTTITSFRKGSTTFVKTEKGKTKTFESTITVTPTETDAPESTGEGVSKIPKVYDLDEGGYFVGKFLPTLLSIILSIPARIIDLNVQLYQPFYALNRPNGALGPNGMTLHFSGWTGFIKPFQILTEGQPVTFLSMLLVWCSALIIPVASEAIGVKIHGYCTPVNPTGCAAALGVSPTSTRALLALLALAIVLLCLLLLFLRNWETGLHANPWSVAGIASLATNREIRPQQSTERKIAKEMRDKRYGFGYFENQHGQTEYGIVLYDDAGQNLRERDNPHGTLSEVSSLDPRDIARRKRRGNPFIALAVWWRLCFMLFMIGLMTLILYYGTTFRSQNKFQNFMAGQNFGIRFLFATIGVIISFGWGALFISVAMIVPYQVMSIMPQSAANSILLTRPTNPFSGVWSAVKHGQPFPAVIALMAIFSEFMPILLANVPYTITQTEITHKICLWLSTSILGLMVLTISVSFYVVWPHMPVDPRSIAGAMYYVSESGMLNQFDGMASFNNKEREQRVQQIGGRYWYGEMMTQSGATRPAVERDDGTLHLNESVTKQPALRINVNPHNIDTAYHGYQPETTVEVPQQQPPQQEQQQQRQQRQQRQQQQPQRTDTTYLGNQGTDNSVSPSSAYPSYDPDVMYYDPPPEVMPSSAVPQHPGTTYYGSNQLEPSLMSPQGHQNDPFDVDTPYYRHQR